MVIAYANHNEIGYVPPAAAYAEGGYEVDTAPWYYGHEPWSPKCEAILVEAAVQAIQDV